MNIQYNEPLLCQVAAQNELNNNLVHLKQFYCSGKGLNCLEDAYFDFSIELGRAIQYAGANKVLIVSLPVTSLTGGNE